MKRPIIFVLVVATLLLSSCREQSKEELYSQGMEFVNNGNYQAAISLFKSALDKDPNFLEARTQLGIAFLQTGKIEKAEGELEKAQRQAPNNSELVLRLAEIYLKTDRPDRTVQMLESLPTNVLDQAEPYFFLAESHLALGNLAEAERYFLKSLSIDPKRSNAQLGYAKLLYMTERIADGDQYVERAISLNPNETPAYYLLFKKSAYLGNKEAALNALEKIYSIDPNDLFATYALGMLYVDEGELEKARKLAEQILQKNPQNPVGHRIEGVVFYQVQDYEKAVESLQKSLMGIQDLAGFYFLGLANYRSGQLEQALSNFQKALDKSPDYEPSRLMVAQTLIKQGRVEDGIREINLILDNNPGSAEAHNMLGSAYLLQNQYDLAMEQINEAIRINPRLAEAHLKKGLFNLAAGKKKQAETDLLSAVNAAPEVMNVRLLLAKYYLSQNNYPKALETLEEALTISPNNALIYNYMAAAQLGQQRKKDAIASLEKAKALKPDFFAPYINLANIYVSDEDYLAAINELEGILGINPQHVQAMLRVAALHEYLNQKEDANKYYGKAYETGDPRGCLGLFAYQMRTGDDTAALTTLEAGIKNHPENTELAMVYGDALQKSGQLDKALLAYKRFEELRPGQGKPHLLKTHLLKGDLAAANEIADQTISAEPSSSLGYILKSMIYSYHSDLRKAENILRRGIDATDKDLDLLLNLANLQLQGGDKNEALKTYESILAEHPNFTPALFMEASIYDATGNKKLAKAQYEKILSLDENHVGALNNLAMLLLDVYNNRSLALEYASRGFRIKPNDPRIIDTLGYALLENGENEKAIVFLQKAHRLMPEEAEVKLHLAKAYKATGRKNDAIASLASINKANAGEGVVREAKALLNELN